MRDMVREMEMGKGEESTMGNGSPVAAQVSRPSSIYIHDSKEFTPSRQSSGTDSKETTASTFPSSSQARTPGRAHQEHRDRHPPLQTFHEMPPWLQDNNCVLSGYRPISHSVHACLRSLTYAHNESVSIFTHLIPSLLFLLAQAVVQPLFTYQYPNATPADRVVLAVFMGCASLCLGVSAMYHTMLNHSRCVSDWCLRCDFVGIVVLTVGFFVSGVYVGFYCDARLRWIYWIMILALASTTIVILILPQFQGPRFRNFRLAAFIGTGMTGFVPIIHGFVKYGWDDMIRKSGVPYYLGEGFLLVLGAVFYSMRIPEVYSPGKFDIYGASHQIFHILVVLATILHLVGISVAFDYNYHHQQC